MPKFLRDADGSPSKTRQVRNGWKTMPVSGGKQKGRGRVSKGVFRMGAVHKGVFPMGAMHKGVVAKGNRQRKYRLTRMQTIAEYKGGLHTRWLVLLLSSFMMVGKMYCYDNPAALQKQVRLRPSPFTRDEVLILPSPLLLGPSLTRGRSHSSQPTHCS